MNHRLVWGFAAASVAIVGCGSDDEESVPTASITVESWDVGLSRGVTHDQRLEAVKKVLPTSTSDVICLAQAWMGEDRDALVDLMASTHPHVLKLDTDWDTVPADQRDAEGNVPDFPDTPPCNTMADLAELDALISCVAENCSTIPGSEDGFAELGPCVQANCLAEGLALYDAEDIPHRRCYACTVATGFSLPLKDSRQECSTNPKAYYDYQGQSSQLMLSKRPLDGGEVVLVPTTNVRGGFLRAKVPLEAGASVDVYCGVAQAILTGLGTDYWGYYGLGETGEQGWRNEQAFHAQRIAEWVAATSSGKAIVAGTFQTGPEVVRNGETLVAAARGVEGWETLASSFTLGVAPSWIPACTTCPDNPWTGGDGPYWDEHIFLHGIDQTAVTATTRTYTENVTEDEEGKPLPASHRFGIRSTIAVPLK